MGYMDEVGKHLDMPPAERDQVLRELSIHHREVREELAARGMAPDAIEREAARRLGAPCDVASRLNAIHCTASWRTALLLAAPTVGTMAGFWARMQGLGPWLSLAVTAILFAGTLRELWLGRRPLWLVSWLVASWQILGILASAPATELTLTHAKPSMWSLILARLPAYAVLIGVCLAAFRHSRRWLAVSLGLAALSIGIGLAHQLAMGHHWWSMAGWAMRARLVTVFALYLLVAMRTFWGHRETHPTHVSLFLFLQICGGFGIGLLHAQPMVDRYPAAYLATVLLPGLAVLLYARASSWRLKLGVLGAGLWLWHLLFGVIRILNGVAWRPAFAMDVSYLVILTLVIILPGALRGRRDPEAIGGGSKMQTG